MATRKTTAAPRKPAAKTPNRAAPRKAAAASRRAAAPRGGGKTLDLVLLGATGYTGRQAVRALVRQRPDAHWAIAGRDEAKLRALAEQAMRDGARAPQVFVADTRDEEALAALAAPAKVVFNLAGPYHATGDAVVAACIAGGAHYLDLSAETFWMQRLIREQHDAAVRAGVRIMPCAGYEALPFDLATLWAAHRLREQCGEPAREVKIAVSVSGQGLVMPSDLVSGGTAATITEILAHDHTDCLRNMACLLPPDAADAAGVAKRNALRWLPRYDADFEAVLAPTLPGPFINPPVVLRGVALIDDETLFDREFVYREGTHMGRALPGATRLPPALTLPLQWSAAAAVAVPLANLAATVTGPLQLQRQALRRLMKLVVPKPGTGPREAALDAMSCELDVFARGASGARFRGRVVAAGHPGYRSTPEMAVCVALGLADGTLGRTPHVGIVSPAAGLGIEAVEALAAADVRFIPGP